MEPTIVTSAYGIPWDSKIDRTRRLRAQRQAFEILRNNETLLYRFTKTGQWSWAAPNSPIAAQLDETGEAYPGAPVDRYFVVRS